MTDTPAAAPIALPTVLIVDDEPGPPAAIRAYLANRAQCVVTCDPFEGLRLIEQQQFGAAFIDINMPGMDGLALIAEIKRRDPHLACIVITGNANLENAEQAVALQAFRYHRKPLDMEKIRATTEQAVQATHTAREAFLSQLSIALVSRNLDDARGRLEKARLQSKMFAGLLHDLGNPLLALQGFASDISEELKTGAHNAAVAGLLNQIEALQSITESFYAAGRVTSTSFGLLKNALQGASILFRQQVKRIPSRPGIVVGQPNENVALRMPFGDALRVINNIGMNALEACAERPGGGVTVVSAVLNEPPNLADLRQQGYVLSQASDELSHAGMYALIEFSDNGCGIASSRLPTLFTSGQTTKANGQGLGLFNTATLLTANKGFAAVFSEEDKGTTFRVYIPCEVAKS